MKEGGLWKEWKEQIGETVESIEHIRREGGDGVEVKLNEGGEMKGERSDCCNPSAKWNVVEGMRFVIRIEGIDRRDC